MAEKERKEKEKGNTAQRERANPFAWNQPDIEKWLADLEVPGVDVGAWIEAERKNFEALREAGEAMNEGWLALAEKQRRILEETVQRWQSSLGAGVPATPAEAVERHAETTRELVTEALSNLQELTEIATGAQARAFEAIRKRFEERMRELTGDAAKD